MINFSRLSTALSANVLSEIANKIFPLIVIGYTARVLGVKEFGFAQYTIYLIDIVLPFVVLGYGNWGIINIAKLSGDNEKIGEQVSSIIVLKLIGASVLVAIFFPILYFVPGLSKYFYTSLLLSFVFLTLALDASFLFFAMRKIPYFTLISFVAKCIGLGLTLLFVREPSDSLLFAALYMGTNSLINVFSFLSIKSLFHLRLRVPKWESLKHVLSSSLPYATSIFFIVFFDRYDLAIVEHLEGEVGAGLYGGPLRIYMSILSLFIAIQVVFFSEMAGEKRENQDKHLTLAVWIMLALVVPMALGGYLLKEELTSLVLGSQFLSAANVFGILCLTFVPQIFILIFGYKYLVILEKVSVVNKIILSFTLVGIASAFILGGRFGIEGIAIANLIGKTGAALGCLLLTFKITNKWPLPRGLGRILVPSIVMALIVGFLRLTMHPLLLIALGAGVYAAIFIPLNWGNVKKIIHLVKSAQKS